MSHDNFDDPMLRAWIDESGSIPYRDPGTYILAAALTTPRFELGAREKMESLRLPGQKKLHWRDEDHRRRQRIAEAIAGLSLAHIVVVRTSAPSDSLQRRRNKSLEALAIELEALGVVEATFESRGPADDRRDLNLIQRLRSGHVLSSNLRVQHTPGPNEPLLWLPDAICGAVTSARTNLTSEYLDALGTQVRIISI